MGVNEGDEEGTGCGVITVGAADGRDIGVAVEGAVDGIEIGVVVVGAGVVGDAKNGNSTGDDDGRIDDGDTDGNGDRIRVG